jgi:hypothetical protein
MKSGILLLLIVSVFAVSEVSGQFGNLGGICNLAEFINSKCGEGNTSW